ncbi:hypothetical protein BHE90_010270 [Fusarium euwallaceae]|uniref:Uncharacterized protein n=1 Tax=Fusarium euwallaceae TaxID=1147111 RepID=A0A430LHR3_9HYPO|nr:hypothetical protein BHE90_010270 [Fusarium euwallaceae]
MSGHSLIRYPSRYLSWKTPTSTSSDGRHFRLGFHCEEQKQGTQTRRGQNMGVFKHLEGEFIDSQDVGSKSSLRPLGEGPQTPIMCKVKGTNSYNRTIITYREMKSDRGAACHRPIRSR